MFQVKLPPRVWHVVGVLMAGSSVLPVAASAQVSTDPCPTFGGGSLSWPSIVAEVRDHAGRPIARGAKLSIRQGEYRWELPPREALDSLTLRNRDPVAGTFHVRVTKPGYAPAETLVHVPAARCGGAERTVRLAMVLRERPSPSPVRSVVIQGPRMVLSPREGPGYPLVAYVDAVPGTDTSVVWSVSDPSVLAISANGEVKAQPIRCRRSASVIATSRAEPRKQGRFEIEVWTADDGSPYCLSRQSRPDGSVRVGLASATGWTPRGTTTSATYAPFVHDHVQAGVAWRRTTTAPFTVAETEGSLTFHLGRHWKSRPFVGAFATATHHLERTHEALGARAGWTYFASPAVAVSAEVRVWDPSIDDSPQWELWLGIDPYAFGSARISRKAPGWGVVDVALAARTKLTAPNDYAAALMVAPFLTDQVQVGGAFAYVRSPTSIAVPVLHDAVDHVRGTNAELFGRYYLPIESRVVPFAGAFVGYRRFTGTRTEALYGPMVGARTSLNRDVALEVVLRRANQGLGDVVPWPQAPGRTSLSVGIVTQLRTRGRAYRELF